MVHPFESMLKSCCVIALTFGFFVVESVSYASERGKPAPVIVIPDDEGNAQAEARPEPVGSTDKEQTPAIRIRSTRELPVKAKTPEPPSELPVDSASAASEVPSKETAKSTDSPEISSEVREAAFTEPLRTKMPSKNTQFHAVPDEAAARPDPTATMSLRVAGGGSAVVSREIKSEPEESAPAEELEPASFNGVVAGKTKEATLFEKWDRPLKTQKEGDVTTHQFKVDPFKLVEAFVEKGVVGSIVIHLETPFPADVVAQQLELNDIRPVLVANELGDVLGQAFPERGVLFAFEPSLKKGQPSSKVRQIVLEPIGPEPFLLRAETHKRTNFTWTLEDLDVVLTMNPDSARAHWIRAGLLLKAGRHEDSLAAARRAVELKNSDPRYRLRCAEALWKTGNPTDALLECQAAVDLAKEMPHVKAAVLLLMGDINAEAPLSNFKKAIGFHMKAIEVAEPAAESRHPAIRLAAKQVLVDAHLAAAIDVASGNWQNKDVAVAKWLASAGSRNEDLIGEEGHAEEHRLELAAAALKACAGAKDALDPAPWGKSLMENAMALIKEREDAIYRLWVRRQTVLGMCDCLRVSHWRGETEQAVSCGEACWEWLEKDFRSPEATDADRMVLGRICFMTGSIHALVNESHEDAVVWFDKADAMFQRNSALSKGLNRIWAADCFVSMGVSYWQTGNKEKAVEVTETGAALLQSLVSEGKAEAARLSVPFGNLAAMHHELGDNEKADLFAQKSKNAERAASEVADPTAGKQLLR